MTYAEIDTLSDELDAARAAYEAAEKIMEMADPNDDSMYDGVERLKLEMYSCEIRLKELCDMRDQQYVDDCNYQCFIRR